MFIFVRTNPLSPLSKRKEKKKSANELFKKTEFIIYIIYTHTYTMKLAFVAEMSLRHKLPVKLL